MGEIRFPFAYDTNPWQHKQFALISNSVNKININFK